ncbi:MAG: T9SS type A sorting domain-containing protein [Bacteroidota bacterium]
MKKTLLISMLVLLSATVFAQVTLYSNNFDSYTVGNKLALVAGNPWTTWSAAPGGAEDGTISATQSHSTTKSVNIVTNNDLVYKFNDKTTGRFNIEWWMFVETGKLGYFNLLSNFNGSSSEWAFQVYNYHDSIFVDAGGTTAAKQPFATNTWKKINLIVDLDDDFTTFYVDGVEIISYQWSKGAQGTGVTKKLDAINFYGWDGTGSPVAGGTAGYYIDDLKVDSVQAPNPPSNLLAVLNGNDIDVTWTAPAPAPDLYKLSRNGAIVYTTVSTLSYTDVAPWPNTYIYGARAHYAGLGYSHSNSDTATIAGGVTRNAVLMEGGTYLTCPYCPGAAMGLRDLIDVNAKDAVAIEYHDATGGDIYNNAFADARNSYYGITGFPTVVADGVLKVIGGNATVSMYSSYLPMYNERIIMPAFYNIIPVITETSPNNFQAVISVDQTFAPFASNMKLHAVLTESNIPQSWGNQTECDFVCRAMYPDANGTSLTFSPNPQTVTINFSTTGYVKNNCEFIMFVQHNTSKEVFQTMMIDMATIVGINELQGNSINLFPNPAKGYFTLNSAGNGNLSVTDMTGKILMNEKISYATQSFDISNFAKGVYLVNVSSEKNSFTKKLVIE